MKNKLLWNFLFSLITINTSEIQDCPLECVCQSSIVDCQHRNLTDDQLLQMAFPVTGYSTLRLDNNNLTRLPAQLFSLNTFSRIHLSGNRLSKIPREGYPKTLQRLYLDDNQIGGRISVGNFSSWCSEVAHLVLSNNFVTAIDDQTFSSCTKLTLLDLDDNRLYTEVIRRQAFSNLTSLGRLSLAGNSIRELSSGVFDEMSGLHVVFLSNNNLARIPAGLFHNIPATFIYLNRNNISIIEEAAFKKGIWVLDLSGNALETIDPRWFTEPTNTSMHLDENPITCSCGLKSVTESMWESFYGKCSTPDTLKGQLDIYALKTIKNCNACSFVDCRHEGVCKTDALSSGAFTCECQGGDYKGRLCHQSKTPCDYDSCKNGATCSDVAENNTFSCQCAEGFKGETCSESQSENDKIKNSGKGSSSLSVLILVGVLTIVTIVVTRIFTR